MKKAIFTLTLSFLVIISSAFLRAGKDTDKKLNYQNFILIEAEDAIATNFAASATTYFFASNRHTLQLNNRSDGDNSFFAKFVFVTTIDREFEIWFGATPPGGINNPYVSPINIKLDDSKLMPVTAESVSMSNRYTHGGFYYYKVTTGRLPAGQHSLQIIIDKGRKFDGKYFFYIDNIMILPKYNKEFLSMQHLPKFFPVSLAPINKFSFKNITSIPRPNQIRNAEIYSYIDALNWTGNHKRSLELFQYLLDRNQADIEAHTGYLLHQLWSGDTKGAFAYAKKLTTHPQIPKADQISLKKFIAQDASWRGDFINAKKWYKEILKDNPDDTEAVIGLGNVYSWGSEFELAIALYENFINRHENIEVMAKVAYNYEQNKDFQRAIIMYKKIIDKVPNDFTAYQKLAAVYSRIGEEDKAQEILKQGRERNAVVQVEKGSLTAGVKKDDSLKEKVIKEYEQLVDKDFFNDQKHRNLLSIYQWYNKEELALKEYNVILSLELFKVLHKSEQDFKDFFHALAKAQYLYNNKNDFEGDPSPEIKALEDQFKALQKYADSYLKEKKTLGWEFKPGKIETRIGNGLPGKHFFYKRLYAIIDYLKGNPRSANASVTENIANLAKAKDELIAPFIMLESSNVAELKKLLIATDYPASYKKIIEDIKKFTDTYVKKQKAKGLGKQDQLRVVIEKAQKFRELIYEAAVFDYYKNQKNMSFLEKLGSYYIHLKDPNNAQSIVEEVLAMQPQNMEANLMLGDLYRWGRKYYSARLCYEKVLQLDPKNKKAMESRDAVLAVYSPKVLFDVSYHQEPIVTRFKIKLGGEYILGDNFALSAFYGFGYTWDTLGILVSTIFSQSKNKFMYHEAGAEVKYNFYSINTFMSAGYFARKYNGELDFDYLSEYSTKFNLPITNNFFATFSWLPLNFPISVYFRYEYADVDELTQAVKMGLFYHYFNAVVNLRFDFLPFFPFDRLFYQGSHEYKIISDDNTRLKSYNKGIFNVVNLPFKGMKLDIGGIYSYEDSKFNIYDQDNDMSRRQVNVPYYAPLALNTYGGFLEWNHKVVKAFAYGIGMNYLMTSQDATIYNPYLIFSGEFNKIAYNVYAAYIYSKSFSTYDSGQKFESYDLIFKITKNFYSDFKQESNKDKEDILKIASDKKNYSIARDKFMAINMRIRARESITSYRIIIHDDEWNIIKQINGSGTPPDKVKWDFTDNNGKHVKAGTFNLKYTVVNNKNETLNSDIFQFSVK